MRKFSRRLLKNLSFAIALTAGAMPLCAQPSAQSGAGASALMARESFGTVEESAGQKKPFAAFSASLSAMRDSLVATARAQIGTRYKLGGEKPGRELDCSSLVRYVMSAFDIALPRTARQQATAGEEVPRDLASLKPGDLLTFGKGKQISHVGIYVGDGRMVHASTSQKKVIETAISTRNPLIRQWTGVRRVVGTTRDSILALADSR